GWRWLAAGRAPVVPAPTLFRCRGGAVGRCGRLRARDGPGRSRRVRGGGCGGQPAAGRCGVILVVALAGGLGAALRYVVDSLVPTGAPDAVPRGTAVVNVSGSFLAGLLGGALAAGALSPAVYAVGVAGFCGGYTTFSTASL